MWSTSQVEEPKTKKKRKYDQIERNRRKNKKKTQNVSCRENKKQFKHLISSQFHRSNVVYWGRVCVCIHFKQSNIVFRCVIFEYWSGNRYTRNSDIESIELNLKRRPNNGAHSPNHKQICPSLDISPWCDGNGRNTKAMEDEMLVMVSMIMVCQCQEMLNTFECSKW